MNKDEVGVGPHSKPWPTDEKFDVDLLKNGDRRNVEDRYRYWKVEAIKNDLSNKSTELEIAIENWQHDFNIGTIVRNANAFNVKKVHIIGKRHWNRRGAMVTDRYLEIIHHLTVGDFVKYNNSAKKIVAIDNQPGSKALNNTDLDKNIVMVFGGEGPGLSEEMIKASDIMIKIPQLGSTRSINVGVASGILMYQWCQSYHKFEDIDG